MASVSRPGARVAYSVTGDGPAVLLGHSLFCTGAMWDGVVSRIDGRYRWVNVELRGHGESTATRPFTLDDLVDDWLAIMEQERIEEAALVGLSTGGMTAMRLALRAPERVTGLALLDTSADREPGLERLQHFLLAWAYARFGVLPRRTLLRAMFCAETLRTRSSLGDATIDTVSGFDRRALYLAMKAVFGRGGVDPSRIDAPTTILVGEHDAATPPKLSRRIHRRIVGSELHGIEGAGHLTALERPDRVAAILQRFLERCTS